MRSARERRSHAVCLLPAPPSVSGEERRAAPPAGQLESRDQRGPTVIRPFKHDGVKTRAVGYVKGGTKPKKKKRLFRPAKHQPRRKTFIQIKIRAAAIGY